MDRILIFGTSYVDTTQMRDLVTLWAKVTTKLNPDCDVMLIDSASPFNPDQFLKDYSVDVHRFPENVGHLSRGGKDGWGRAFCRGLEIAVNARNGDKTRWDYVAYIDSDIIFTRPVRDVFKRMERGNIVAACPLDLTYQFVENGLCFFDLAYVEETELHKKYDWESTTLTELPERKFERLIGDDLWLLPYRGLRNDFDRLTMEGYDQAMPFGVDFLTHCRDTRLYLEMLRRVGIEL